MNLTRLPNPPHPMSFASQSAWMQAAYQWMSDTKAQIEADSTASVYGQSAILSNAALTGTPTAPTASPGTNSTQIATTAFVATSFAPLNSPALTGTPTAPTPTAGNSSTDIATTAFVATSFAPLNSPAFTGTPTAPTPTAGNNSSQIATTAFVAAYAPLTSPAFSGTPTAPTAASGTSSTQLATTAFVAPSFDNVGRNLLHNGMFNIQQRGAGPFTSPGYTADRWRAFIVSDTASFSLVALSDADRAAIGDEAAQYALQNVFTGNSATGAFNEITQPIENVRRLGGKTITLSFWAKAASGTPSLGFNAFQGFGTGGSPSTAVQAQATGNLVTLSTTWTRYSTTLTIPSTSGKTLGTNNDHYTLLEIGFSSGATDSATFGGLGVQSGTIQLWGLQLEIGASLTPLEKIDPQIDIANCKRFYQAGNGQDLEFSGYATAGLDTGHSVPLIPQMRATPTTVNYNFGTLTNCTATLTAMSNNFLLCKTTASATGGFTAIGGWNASADLSP
jgi:hypothetical protein